MPRYFFNVQEGETVLPDNLGTELADMREVRGEAIRAAGEMLADVDGSLDGQEWQMNVTDAGGKLVLRLHFSAVEEA